MNRFWLFLTGLVVGLLVGWLTMWTTMPRLMMNVHESRLSFEATVQAVQAAAGEAGWQVPKVYDIQKSLRDAGHADMTPLTVISMCQPEYAYAVLKEPGNRTVAGIMPCRVGVYEDDDGKVWVTSLNVGLMSRMFGGTIEEVMGKVAREEERMMEGIVVK